MNEEKTIKADAIPYIAFESVQARNERHFKRLWIIILVLIGALIASNFAWIWYLFGVDFETYDVDMDAGQGDALYNYIGEDGDIYNGADKNTTEENNEDRRTG